MTSPAVVRQALSGELPPVTLLVGEPASDLLGLARLLVTAHGVHPGEVLQVAGVPLDAAAARAVAAYAGVQPLGRLKAVIAVLDGSSEQAQNILLKTLEEPPDSVRFLLIATRPPLDTVVSRARVFRVRPRPAPAPEVPDEARARAGAAVRAALAQDPQLFALSFRAWDEKCPCPDMAAGHARGRHYLDALRSWAVSQGSRRPGLFPGGPLEPEVPAAMARRVLRLLAECPKGRPANAAFHALYQVFLADAGS